MQLSESDQTTNMSEISKISRTFSKETSIHGMRRLHGGPLLYRVIWLLMVVGTITGFFIHLGQLLSRYAEYPVNTENFEGDDDFEFPSVTICPNDYIHYDYRSNPIPDSATGGRSLSDMVYDLARVWYRIKVNETTIPFYPYSEYDSGKFSMRQVAYRSQQFQSLQDTVVYCRFNSRDCTYEEFTPYKDPVKFLCFTFTPSNRKGVQTDERNGLFLILYSYSNSFLTEEDEINHIPGFSVTLHEPGVNPDLSKAIVVPLRQRVSVDLRQRIESKLDRGAYPCSDDLGHVTYVSDYSQSGGPEFVEFKAKQRDCQLRVLQMQFVEECGCLAEHLPIPADLLRKARPCHEMWEPIFFMDVRPATETRAMTIETIINGTSRVVDFEEFFQANADRWVPMRRAALCFDRVQSRQSSLLLGDDCVRLCHRYEFPISITATSWPMDSGSIYSATAINSSLDKFLDRAIAKAELATNETLNSLRKAKNRTVPAKFENFCLLDLHLSTTNSFHSREDWVYPMRNLLSDLGGILGLWIGASIITMVELIELLIRIGAALPWQRRSEKDAPKLDSKIQPQ